MTANEPIILSPPTDAERVEIAAIIKCFGAAEHLRLYQLVEGQLAVIHARAVSLMQLSGVVVTVTGFSGRIIADTNDTAQALIVSGVALVGLAAVVSLLFVMPIRWLTTAMHLETEAWLLWCLRRRAKKTRAFRIATGILVVGMVLYLTAIAIMLFNPEATELLKVR